MPISPDDFKKLTAKFATGVTIVTFADASGPHGLTVNAFSSISLEPPLVLICIDKNARGHEILLQCKSFVVNILSDVQEELCMKFATPKLSSKERYADAGFRLDGQNIPIFDENLATLSCSIIGRHTEGDHTIFIGRVEDGGKAEDRIPLLFYSGKFHLLT